MSSSTIQITIDVLNTDNTGTLGAIRIGLDTGAPLVFSLAETLVNSASGIFEMRRATGQLSGPSGDLGEEQALYFQQAFSRDYLNTGGQGNLSVSRSGNVVTITSQNGQFVNNSYDGDVLSVQFQTTNGTIVVPAELTLTRLDTGDCDTIQYSASATGDGAPFTLSVNGANVITEWDGTTQNIDLTRGGSSAIRFMNSSNEAVRSFNEIVPRKLIPGEFKERTTTFVGFTDVLIESVNPIAGTEPVQYSLENEGTLTGGNYQESNSFPGVTDGTYELFIRDRFGCEVSKTIVLVSFDTGEDGGGGLINDFRYFEVVPLNSIPFSEQIQHGPFAKKNRTNTLSYNDDVEIPYLADFGFVDGDIVFVQFKSSYTYHNVTLSLTDGTVREVGFDLIQENLGTTERVDCKMFQYMPGQIGVYFDGGNTYSPNTNNILPDPSPYGREFPSWAVEGGLIGISSLGLKRIQGVEYSSDLGKFFFTIEGTVLGNIDDIVQATFNAQQYNLFQFGIAASSLIGYGQLTLEAGYDFDMVERTFVSECFEKLEDDSDYLLMRYGSDRNVGGLVFSNTGYEGLIRVKGKFRSYPKSISEVQKGDDRTYSLRQESYIGYRLEMYHVTPKIWELLNNVSGMSKDGGSFSVNGLRLTRSGEIEQEESGESNLSKITIEFDFGGNTSIVTDAEVVTNPSTGVTGSGGTGKPGELPDINFLPVIEVGGNVVVVGGSDVGV